MYWQFKNITIMQTNTQKVPLYVSKLNYRVFNIENVIISVD